MKTRDKSGEKNSASVISRRDALKLGGTLLVGTMLPGCVSALGHPTVVVGDPAQPAALPSAIIDAYNRGARHITIKPGAYVLPTSGKNSIELAGWENTAIRCKDVTIIFEETRYCPVMLNRCSNVTIEDAILQFAGISYTQGKIKEIGKDAVGKYVDWQIDAGYPTDINPARTTYNVIDQYTRLLKVGTGDCGVRETTPSGDGRYRLYQMNGQIGNAAVGDWLVCRAPGGTSIIQLDDSQEWLSPFAISIFHELQRNRSAM